MTHPIVFDDNDPILLQVREIALAFPAAQEKISHGRPAFFTTKVFVNYSGSVKGEGEWVQHPHALIVQADLGEREALRQMPGTFVPAYLGAAGWMGLDLDGRTDWEWGAELSRTRIV